MARRANRHRPRESRRLGKPSSAGGLLRQAREKAGLTQAELGRRLGHTQQAVAQAERENSNPTVAFLRKWAEACGRTLSIRIR